MEARSLSTLGGGVRRYTVEVISRILKKSSDEFAVYYDSKKYLGMFPNSKEKAVPVFHPLFRIAWDYFMLPKALKKDRIELVHYFKPATTPFKKPLSIATMYDVIPLLHPETQTKIQLAYWKKQLPLVAKTCDHLITISESAKNDIVNLLNISPDKITVTPLGVDEKFKRADEEKINAIKEKYSLNSPFFLFVGTIEPRKNIAKLIKAFDSIADQVPHELVITGKWGWKFDDVKEALGNARSKDKIKILSYVDGVDLVPLYSAADVFVFPSLYEGFGLPVLEALACGVPVITSNVSSLPEAVGENGILINPESEEGIAQSMLKLAQDEALKKDLSQKGTEWAKNFTWEKTAEETLKVYDKVLGR